MILEVTGKDLDFFTDRYRLVGEGKWSFRAISAPPALLDEFEARAGRLKAKRVENLANNFAGALLMPVSRLQPLWERRESVVIHEWSEHASRFEKAGGAAQALFGVEVVVRGRERVARTVVDIQEEGVEASGVVGIGEGILLSPLLQLGRWASAKESVVCACVFIFLKKMGKVLGFEGLSLKANPALMCQAVVERSEVVENRRRFMQKAREFFEEADIEVNGSRPWDIRVNDRRIWRRVVMYGGVGLGDAYVDGGWDAESVDELICRMLKTHHSRRPTAGWMRVGGCLQARLRNLQTLSRAFQVGEQHYDLGNELYERMLDGRMVYSCGYWREGADSLDEAQEHKLDLVCRKLQLKPGMRVLDIGSGWGSFCEYAAREYEVEVVGLTVSKEQAGYSRERCADLPVEILLEDYRTYEGEFDRIASIGMFEHVGVKNYPAYFQMARRCLRAEGLFLLHTIGAPRSVQNANSWHAKRIFPNGYLPSLQQIAHHAERGFVVEDLHNFGADYDRTLMAWWENFQRVWPELRESVPEKYTERFYRTWKYYLLSSAGAFRARHLQLWQWVLSPEGVPGGYQRP